MAAFLQDEWMEHLQVTARGCCKTVLEGCHVASTMLLTQAAIMDTRCGTDCKTTCGQQEPLEMAFTVPTGIAEDEVSYPLAGTPGVASPGARLGGVSPSFSPRGFSGRADFCQSRDKEAANIWSRASSEAQALKPNIVDDIRQSQATYAAMATMQAPRQLSDETLAHMAMDAPAPNYGYYAEHEYHPILRPPSSVMSSNINTSVRAAPWDRWTNQAQQQATPQQMRPQATPQRQAAPSAPSIWASAPPATTFHKEAERLPAVLHPIDEPIDASARESFGALGRESTTQSAQSADEVKWEEIAACFNMEDAESHIPELPPSVGAVAPSPPGGAVPVVSPWSAPTPTSSPAAEMQEPTAPKAKSKANATKSVLSQSMIGKSPIASLLSSAQPTLRAQADSAAAKAKARGSAEATQSVLWQGAVFESPAAASLAQAKAASQAPAVQQASAGRSQTPTAQQLPGASPSAATAPQAALQQPTKSRAVPAPAPMEASEPAAQPPASQSSVTEPKRAKPASERKSTLSVSAQMTSGAAAALGGLTAKRQSSSKRSSDSETMVSGATPSVASAPQTTLQPPTKSRAAPAPVRTEASRAPEEASEASSRPSKVSSRQAKGGATKSVISNLNGSSSSASALLGPMLQGNPKRRSARPEGSDAKSVL